MGMLMWLWVTTPYPPVNIRFNPTKKGSNMGGEFTYPKMGSQNGFDPQPWFFCLKQHWKAEFAVPHFILRRDRGGPVYPLSLEKWMGVPGKWGIQPISKPVQPIYF